MNHDQIINKILPLIWKVIMRVQACWLNIYVLLAAQMLSDFLVNTLSIEATREQRVGLNDKIRELKDSFLKDISFMKSLETE